MRAAITFDVFYTLLMDTNREETWRLRVQAVAEVLAEHSDARPTDQIHSALLEVDDAREAAWASSLAHLSTEVAVNRLANAMSISPCAKPELVDRLAAVIPPSVQVVDDAVAILDRLRRAGFALGIVSNLGYLTQPHLLTLLSREGLLRYFHGAVVSSDLVGCYKPHRAMFDAAIASLDTCPALTTHVGDSFDADVIGAIGAGCAAVLSTWFRDEQPLAGDLRFHRAGSLAETAELLLQEGRR